MNASLFTRVGVLALAALHLVLIPLIASEALESDDFRTLAVKAREKAARYGTDQVLLVHDIDNTLLAMNQPLGSDQWYNWQEGLILGGRTNEAVAADITGLLAIQGKLYALGHMHPPQKESPGILRELQAAGFASLALTSRGYDFRDATARELASNGYTFGPGAPGPRGGYAGTYLPYDPNRPAEAGLATSEVTAFKLGPARPVSYMDGIFMGSGQHKGVMLRTLVKKTARAFKAIVFIDDQKKHCDRIRQAFGEGAAQPEAAAVDVVTIRYSREDGVVKAFDDGDKGAVTTAWETLDGALHEVFGEAPREAAGRRRAR